MLGRARRRADALAVAMLAIGTIATLPAASSGHPADDHTAHVQTDDVQRARAGYVAAAECAQDPKYGGMGIHYTNRALLADGKLDITKPEVLVYEPTPSGKLRLGAIEYFQADADQDLTTAPDRPQLFGMPFDGPMLGHEPGMPIHYDLHVWLYRHNPAGLFAMWNPRVHCPDATH
jgi:hypothetical protein